MLPGRGLCFYYLVVLHLDVVVFRVTRPFRSVAVPVRGFHESVNHLGPQRSLLALDPYSSCLITWSMRMT